MDTLDTIKTLYQNILDEHAKGDLNIARFIQRNKTALRGLCNLDTTVLATMTEEEQTVVLKYAILVMSDKIKSM